MTSANNENDASPEKPVAKLAPCPICKKLSVAEYEPFCSKRCADVDLHRWFTGGYGIPATEEDDSAGEEG